MRTFLTLLSLLVSANTMETPLADSFEVKLNIKNFFSSRFIDYKADGSSLNQR